MTRGVLEEEDFLLPSIGSASTLTQYDKPVRVPRRAFPPGFHGANPGPSHEEPTPAGRSWKAEQ